MGACLFDLPGTIPSKETVSLLQQPSAANSSIANDGNSVPAPFCNVDRLNLGQEATADVS